MAAPPRTRAYALALLLGAGVGGAGFWLASRPGTDASPPAPAAPAPVPDLEYTTHESPHYRIRSTAEAAETALVAEHAEAVLAAYVELLGIAPPAGRDKLQVVLYRDRAQFKAHNRSRPWAEAYYLAPACHAYFDRDMPDPTHWLRHEAVHQLMREVSRYPRRAWSDEGFAAYVSASRLRDGRIVPGEVNAEAYPVWWLRELRLDDDPRRAFAARRLVPLRALISGRGGPPIDESVNAHYIGYWSLAHFLLHHDGGRHGAAFRELLATGGDLAAFERLVGPVEAIEAQWYAHLRTLVAGLEPPADDDAVVVDFQ